MANKKLGPVEGELCWFCKLPGDDDSWMGLGILKSTREPVFNGHHILFHECCAVYSCGAEDIPAGGMDDSAVLKFYRHGEKASGIGLKCQLCGKRGATTGCFYGPCQQFYHYTCARARSYQGYLRFSLDGKTLACMEHIPLLPAPHEENFMGMWMEGLGSWNGALLEKARETWHPSYQLHLAHFLQKYEFLLNMTPAADLRAMQALAKGQRKNIKAKVKSTTREDPDYRVKGGSGYKLKKSLEQAAAARASSSGGSAAAAAAAAAAAGGDGFGGKRPSPLAAAPAGWAGLGVPMDVAAAADLVQFAGSGGGSRQVPTTSRSSLMDGGVGEVFSPSSAKSKPQVLQTQLPPWQQQQQEQEQYAQAAGYAAQFQEQQQQQHDSGAVTRAGGMDDAAAAAALPQPQPQPQSAPGNGQQVLRNILRQTGLEVGHACGSQCKEGATHTAAAPLAISYQLLLAAAGFSPMSKDGPLWPKQQQWAAAAAGGQQQQQQGDVFGAAPAGLNGQSGVKPRTIQLDHFAAAAGGGSSGQCGAPAAAAAAVPAGFISHAAIKEAAAKSGSGATSADSAAGAHHRGRAQQQTTRMMPGAGREQQQQQQQARAGSAFRFTAGVLVGPGGPTQAGKPCKLLDMNILARTGRKQLSFNTVNLEAHSARQPPQPLQQPSQPPKQEPARAPQQQQQPLQGLQALLPQGLDVAVVEKVAAAVKAAAEAHGGQPTPDLLATVAMAVARAAASKAGGTPAGGPDNTAVVERGSSSGGMLAAAAAAATAAAAGGAGAARAARSPAVSCQSGLLADEQLLLSDPGEAEPEGGGGAQQQPAVHQDQPMWGIEGKAQPASGGCAGGVRQAHVLITDQDQEVAELLGRQYGR